MLMFCYNVFVMQNSPNRAPRPGRTDVHPLVKAAAGAALAAGGLFLLAGHGGGSDKPAKSADEAAFCVPTGEQKVHINSGDGVATLIHKIKGSGEGAGDPCWSESESAVKQVTGDIPQAGQDIVLPTEMVQGQK